MPEVPGGQYQPFFTEQAPERRVPLREVNAPPAAFGTEMANALNLFGQNLKEAGGEVFNRAIALRHMEIESGVRDAVTAHFNNMAPDQQEFMSAQGNNASQDKMNGLLAKQDAARLEARDNVAKQYGPYGQKLFDDQAASMQRSFTREAILHSATEGKKVHNQSIVDSINAKLNEMRLVPMDSGAYKTKKDELTDLVRKQGDIWGSDPASVDYNTKKAISGLTASRIDGMVDTGQVWKAADYYTKSLADGSLQGAEGDKVLHRVQAGINGTGAHQTYESLRTGEGMELGKTVVDKQRARDAIAGVEEGAKGYMSVGPMTEHGEALGRYQVLESNLKDWLKKAGMPDMTRDAFLKDNKAQDQLFDTIFGEMMTRHKNFNDAAAEWFTGSPKGLAGIDPSRSDKYHTVTEYVKGANRALAKSATRDEIDSIARDKAAPYTGIDPDAPGIWSDKVADLIHRDRLRDNADLVGLKTRFDDLMDKGGLHDMTDVQRDPEGASILDAARRIPNGQQWIETLEGRIRTHMARDETPSPDRDKNFYRLMGMANDLERQKEFSSTDLYREDLTASQRNSLRHEQDLVRRGKYDPMKVKAAMHDLDEALGNQGIRRSNTDADMNNKYLMFQGMLAEKFADMASKDIPIPHEPDKLIKLARPMLQSVGGTWNPFGKDDVFQHPFFQPPSAIRNFLNADARTRLKINRDLYPEEMGHVFQRMINSRSGQEKIRELLGEEGAKPYAPGS